MQSKFLRLRFKPIYKCIHVHVHELFIGTSTSTYITHVILSYHINVIDFSDYICDAKRKRCGS